MTWKFPNTLSPDNSFASSLFDPGESLEKYFSIPFNSDGNFSLDFGRWLECRTLFVADDGGVFTVSRLGNWSTSIFCWANLDRSIMQGAEGLINCRGRWRNAGNHKGKTLPTKTVHQQLCQQALSVSHSVDVTQFWNKSELQRCVLLHPSMPEVWLPEISNDLSDCTYYAKLSWAWGKPGSDYAQLRIYICILSWVLQ